MHKLVLLLTLGLLSWSCQSNRQVIDDYDSEVSYVNSELNLDSQLFQDGFRDGCSSGLRLAGDKKYQFTKDITRFREQSDYERAWMIGRAKCSSRSNSSHGKVTDSIEYPAYHSKTYDDPEMQEMWETLRK